jgi:cytochrome c oxidase cbb3-type subunit 2
MPSYRDSFPDEDRWALSYFVVALSAYKDPLSLQPVSIKKDARAALNDLELVADKPERAYVSDPSVPASGPPAPPGEEQAPAGG